MGFARLSQRVAPAFLVLLRRALLVCPSCLTAAHLPPTPLRLCVDVCEQVDLGVAVHSQAVVWGRGGGECVEGVRWQSCSPLSPRTWSQRPSQHPAPPLPPPRHLQSAAARAQARHRLLLHPTPIGLALALTPGSSSMEGDEELGPG